MKTLLLNLIFLSSILSNLNSQSCDVAPILYEEYEKDIKHLTLSRLNVINAPESNLAEISEIWSDTIWEGLAAIYNSDLPQKKTVFDDYCIHHNDGNTLQIFHTLYVNVDTSTSWYSNWFNNNIQTNIPEIDSFIQRYNFELAGTLSSAFKITTGEFLNLYPLADTMEIFDGVIFSEVKPYIGAGNRIIYHKENEERFYDFILGWGDCQSGCINNYTWSFKVNENCVASFLGEYGDTNNFPTPINCDISNVSSTLDADHLSSLKIFPNPTQAYVNLLLEGKNSTQLKFTIYDLRGKELHRGYFQNKIEVDISIFSKGIYILSIEDENKQTKNFKLVKD